MKLTFYPCSNLSVKHVTIPNNNNNVSKIFLLNFRMSSHMLALKIFLININASPCCQALPEV